MHDKRHFQTSYAGKPPWDIGRPQKPFLDVADRIVGSILDAGCGTGDTALFFARRGHKVMGIDFIEELIQRAEQKALEGGHCRMPSYTFLVKDALTLKDWTEEYNDVIDGGLSHILRNKGRRCHDEGLATVLKPGGRFFLRFDNVIDSGLFHVFSDEDRQRYVEGLATVLKPGGRVFLMCFSDEEPGTHGPRRVSKKELHDAFAEGWIIESIEPARVEVRPDFKEFSFGEGGPKAWFAVVRRKA